MAKNAGITKAQNNVFDQTDNAIGGRTNGDEFSVGGAASAPAFNPVDGNMWFGAGNPNTNWNLTDNAKVNLESGLKVIHRQGEDYQPTGTGPNGEQDYTVNAGTQIGNPARAEWNFNYEVNTAAGSTVDLTKGLDGYDFKMAITQSGPQFLDPKTVIYDLDPSTHVWVDESNPLLGFGGDDFQQPGASAAVMAHIAENSVNLGFAALQAEFGPLSQSTAAGTEYDIKLTGFAGGTGNLQTFTNDHITLVAPTV
jgi:hypothetical protein